MSTNAGGSLGHRRQIAQCRRCLPHLRGSFSSTPSSSSQMHYLDCVEHITTKVLSQRTDALKFLGED